MNQNEMEDINSNDSFTFPIILLHKRLCQFYFYGMENIYLFMKQSETIIQLYILHFTQIHRNQVDNHIFKETILL